VKLQFLHGLPIHKNIGGKKASRKLHLNYDLDDVQGGGDDYYYDYCSDDDYERNGEEDRIQCSNSPGLAIKQPSPHGQRKESIEKPVVKSFHNNTQNHNDFANTNPQKKDAPPPMIPTRNVVRLYHKRPRGKHFSTVLLEGGHESALLHIASFLDLRSISALSCTNKCWHQTLANPNLYCSCSVMLLPCVLFHPPFVILLRGVPVAVFGFAHWPWNRPCFEHSTIASQYHGTKRCTKCFLIFQSMPTTISKFPFWNPNYSSTDRSLLISPTMVRSSTTNSPLPRHLQPPATTNPSIPGACSHTIAWE